MACRLKGEAHIGTEGKGRAAVTRRKSCCYCSLKPDTSRWNMEISGISDSEETSHWASWHRANICITTAPCFMNFLTERVGVPVTFKTHVSKCSDPVSAETPASLTYILACCGFPPSFTQISWRYIDEATTYIYIFSKSYQLTFLWLEVFLI
jgi:hypothetical protein